MYYELVGAGRDAANVTLAVTREYLRRKGLAPDEAERAMRRVRPRVARRAESYHDAAAVASFAHLASPTRGPTDVPASLLEHAAVDASAFASAARDALGKREVAERKRAAREATARRVAADRSIAADGRARRGRRARGRRLREEVRRSWRVPRRRSRSRRRRPLSWDGSPNLKGHDAPRDVENPGLVAHGERLGKHFEAALHVIVVHESNAGSVAGKVYAKLAQRGRGAGALLRLAPVRPVSGAPPRMAVQRAPPRLRHLLARRSRRRLVEAARRRRGRCHRHGAEYRAEKLAHAQRERPRGRRRRRRDAAARSPT